MINKKTMLLSVSLLFLNTVHFNTAYSMEDGVKQSEQQATQQNMMVAMVATNMNLSPSTMNLSSSSMPSWQDLASYGMNALSSGFKSTVETIGNKVSDVKVLSKLGHPETDPISQAELQKFCAIRDRHMADLIALTMNEKKEIILTEQFKEDVAFMNRRREYVQRGVMYALNNIVEGTQILQFITNNYELLIDPFLAYVINRALELKKEDSEKETQTIKTILVLSQNKQLAASTRKDTTFSDSNGQPEGQPGEGEKNDGSPDDEKKGDGQSSSAKASEDMEGKKENSDK